MLSLTLKCIYFIYFCACGTVFECVCAQDVRVCVLSTFSSQVLGLVHKHLYPQAISLIDPHKPSLNDGVRIRLQTAWELQALVLDSLCF